jgi:hypothetical protein
MRIFHGLLIALAGSVAVLPVSEAEAQNLPAACSLLTTGEVGRALGMSLRPPADVDMRVPIGPAKGQTMRNCVWPTGPQNGVTLTVAPVVPSAVQPNNQQGYDMLKKQGYTVDERTFGNGMCLALTPPAAARPKIFVTTCTLEAKGKQLVMMVPSTTSAVPNETVKKLVDQAVARLP